MRNVLLFTAVLMSMTVFGQQGRQLLRNQAGRNDMNVKLNISAYNFGHKRGGRVYRCGSSEVFLRLPQNGYYTVELGNQMMSNPYGKYRFFDVNAGRNILSIYRNDYLIYRTSVRVPSNSRVVLDYYRGRLYLLEIYRKHNDADIWMDRYTNQLPISDNRYDDFPNGNDWRDRQPIDEFRRNRNRFGRNGMSSERFNSFKRTINNTSFDNDKLELLTMYLKSNPRFSASQIKELAETMSFDSGQLKMAKKLYDYCDDKENYYKVADVFSFSSSKRELSRYISNKF